MDEMLIKHLLNLEKRVSIKGLVGNTFTLDHKKKKTVSNASTTNVTAAITRTITTNNIVASDIIFPVRRSVKKKDSM